jgi:sensor c-di-GMP phosphodiesterase-like protein
MGLQIVAEGVETQSQADFLNSRRQVIHQGYLYGRPLEAHAWLMSLAIYPQNA